MTTIDPADPLTAYLSAVRGAGETADRRAEIAWLSYLGGLEQEHGDQPVAVQQAGAQFLSGLLENQSLAPDASLAHEQDAQLGFAVYRAAERAQGAIRADQEASFLEALQLRQNAIEAAAQDITVNPQAQRALDAGLAGIWRDLVNLGPREGFALGEVAVPPDATRTGFLSADEANRHYQAVSDRAVEAIVWGQWRGGAQDEDAASELLGAFTHLREDQRARLGERMRASIEASELHARHTRESGEAGARNAIGAARGAVAAEGFAMLRAGVLRADWLSANGAGLHHADREVLRLAVSRVPASDDPATLAGLMQAAEDADRDEFAERAARAVRAGRLTPAGYAAAVARNRVDEPAPHREEYLRVRDALGALAPPHSPARAALDQARAVALDELDRWRRANAEATPGEARKAADEIMTRARLNAWERASARLDPPADYAGSVETLDLGGLAAMQRAVVAALQAGRLDREQALARLTALSDWRDALALKPAR